MMKAGLSPGLSQRLEAGGLDLGEFRAETLIFCLLALIARPIGKILGFERVGLQVIHLPLAGQDSVGIIVFGQFIALLADAGDVV
jgi:hypothetical protein